MAAPAPFTEPAPATVAGALAPALLDEPPDDDSLFEPFDDEDDVLPLVVEFARGAAAAGFADEVEVLGPVDDAGLEDDAAGADVAAALDEDSGAAAAAGAEALPLELDALELELEEFELDEFELDVEGDGVAAACCCFFHVA